MIDYQPNKVILTGEDAVKFAVSQMQAAASVIQITLSMLTTPSASEIARKLEEGKTVDGIDLAHKETVALYGAVQGIEIVCSKECCHGKPEPLD